MVIAYRLSSFYGIYQLILTSNWYDADLWPAIASARQPKVRMDRRLDGRLVAWKLLGTTVVLRVTVMGAQTHDS